MSNCTWSSTRQSQASLALSKGCQTFVFSLPKVSGNICTLSPCYLSDSLRVTEHDQLRRQVKTVAVNKADNQQGCVRQRSSTNHVPSHRRVSGLAHSSTSPGITAWRRQGADGAAAALTGCCHRRQDHTSRQPNEPASVPEGTLYLAALEAFKRPECAVSEFNVKDGDIAAVAHSSTGQSVTLLLLQRRHLASVPTTRTDGRALS